MCLHALRENRPTGGVQIPLDVRAAFLRGFRSASLVIPTACSGAADLSALVCDGGPAQPRIRAHPIRVVTARAIAHNLLGDMVLS